MPIYVAEVVEGYCSTDRKSGRLSIPGKGRYGNRLIVRKAGAVVLDLTMHLYREAFVKEVQRLQARERCLE